jgi:hypothetical protein
MTSSLSSFKNENHSYANNYIIRTVRGDRASSESSLATLADKLWLRRRSNLVHSTGIAHYTKSCQSRPSLARDYIVPNV